ncbi:hypothetical protein C8P63_12124 [Melghirimyces profundicolus]|uniref:Phosphotriesterase family protein n=1 Tax=Melghirimyces profundicolus TaxID=1242148 RepID=A0A2T6BGF9_9BACL|nr:hypothetical protein [Melghirimyces profundicolus]PTX55144.1 hypothetical protein C8P63_12124 [Melghirimyces profundicolus]
MTNRVNTVQGPILVDELGKTPDLRRFGVTQEQMDQMLIKNPQRLFGGSGSGTGVDTLARSDDASGP